GRGLGGGDLHVQQPQPGAELPRSLLGLVRERHRQGEGELDDPVVPAVPVGPERVRFAGHQRPPRMARKGLKESCDYSINPASPLPLVSLRFTSPNRPSPIAATRPSCRHSWSSSTDLPKTKRARLAIFPSSRTTNSSSMPRAARWMYPADLRAT